MRRALAWIARHTGDDLDAVLVAAEGTGSYGALLSDVGQAGYRVVEEPTPKRERGRGMTDTPVLAARATMAMPVTMLRDRRCVIVARAGPGRAGGGCPLVCASP